MVERWSESSDADASSEGCSKRLEDLEGAAAEPGAATIAEEAAAAAEGPLEGLVLGFG